MKPLKEVMKGIEAISILGPTDCQIRGISFDSRKVGEGFLFVAIKGTTVDGHQFIDQVIKAGVTAILCETLPHSVPSSITFIAVADSSKALGITASNWFGKPSGKLKLVGITGTNGKTTTVTLLQKLFLQLGYHVGLLSTIKNKIDEAEIPSTHTTPDAIQLNGLLDKMVSAGCTHCFMEVSSHAVVQNRIAGLSFSGAIFSNITHDHLDFHKTFDAYLKAKKRFFDDLPAGSFALTNRDDRNGIVMVQNTKATVKTYSIKGMADFKGRIIETPLDGIHLDINGQETWCRLVGTFNGYNLLAVYATALLMGENETEVLRILSNLESVEGRFDYLRSPEGTIAIVDYAHTPDALTNVLQTINELRKGESLITVVGCGGDRDRSKRPVMAGIAASMSDKVILTSDNPRSEDPAAIIKEMQAGIGKEKEKKVISITDRREAIRTACLLAKAGDVVLVAGKGHEKYQEIAGVKYPFDDKQILSEILLGQ